MATRQLVSAWWIAAVMLFAWFACLRRIERFSWPYLALVLLGIAALLLDWLLPSRYATYAGGVFGGGLLILVVELSSGPGQACSLVAAADRELAASPRGRIGNRHGRARRAALASCFRSAGTSSPPPERADPGSVSV